MISEPTSEKGYPSYEAVNRRLTEEMIAKCKKASFVELNGVDWCRVDGYEPEEQILYVHDEDSGEEYSLEYDDLAEGCIFYEVKEIK
tara:strand:- start:2860 stop:3120 length:261 start_codon:yes stop_codon:yes gene_type:complete